MKTTKTTKTPPKFYLGWRGNPQLNNGGYYKAFGQLSKTDAKQKEECAYGSMIKSPEIGFYYPRNWNRLLTALKLDNQ